MDNKLIDNIIVQNTMDYSAYVLLDRCLPDLRDGLKPVHRRIIYTMHLEKATKLTKSANIEGAVMKLHPHGSTYDTIVNMVQRDKQNIPYLVGKGNFSSHASRDLQYGASRYTEVKLSELSKEILSALTQKTVSYVPNYDGSIMIPEVLPVQFPTILTHCNSGIGVGMSSSIPSFNITELCNAICNYIDTGEKVDLYPDFPTGGYIIKDEKAISRINNEGLGTIRLRGKATINGNIISITEIPYTTTREAIIDKVVELNKKGDFKEITDIKDLTGLEGMEIEITCRKNTDMELLLERIYANTPLESTFSANMNMLVDGLPRVMGVWDTVDKWISWRIECVKEGLRNDILLLEKENHILKGYGKVVLDIDKAIDIIRNSEEDFIIEKLCNHFDIDNIQAEYISNMKLRNINKKYILNKLQEKEKVEATIESRKRALNNEEILKRAVRTKLVKAVEKYGQDRKSGIITLSAKTVDKIKKLQSEVPDYNVRVVCTKDGYVKKIPLTSNKGEDKYKEGDCVIAEFETTNKGELLIFADTDCYKIPLNNIDDSKPSLLGSYIPNISDCKSSIVGYSILDEKYKFILICYKNGKIAKVDLKSFVTSTQRKKLSNSLSSLSEVSNMLTFSEEKDFLIVNTKGAETKKNTSELNIKTTRNTQGVNTIRNVLCIREI